MMKMKLKLRSCLLPLKSLVRITGSASFPAKGCAGVPGVSSRLSAAVWLWWAALSGRASSGCAGWSFGVLLVGPVGVALRIAWLGGGLSASALGLRGFAVVWLSLKLSSVSVAGVLSWGGEGRSAVSNS